MRGLFAKQGLDPVEFNPFRRRFRRKTPQEKERENADGWKLLEAGLTEHARGMK